MQNEFHKIKKDTIQSIHAHMQYILRSKAWQDINDPAEKLQRAIDYVLNETSKETGYDIDFLKSLFMFDYFNQMRELYNICGKDIFISPITKKETKKKILD